MSKTVIIFGPTGAVGSAAARTAHSLGATVILAMRDTTKPIPSLTPAEEQSGRYSRVQADLTNPESVQAAVTKTSAKHAFIYTALQGSSDHMRASAEALKAAGIESVVVLSTLAITGDLHAVPREDFIGYGHAQVELTLEEVFGVTGYVALRPAFFASNSSWWRAQILESGVVELPFPELKFDYISPEDIGTVGGRVLVSAVDLEGRNFVNLVGPEGSLSMYEAVETIGKVIGKEAKAIKVDQERGLEVMVTKGGVPEFIGKTLIAQMSGLVDVPGGVLGSPVYSAATGNLEKYLERPPMRFSEWVEKNRGIFAA